MTKYKAFKIRLQWNSQGKIRFIPLWLVSQKTGVYRDLGNYSSFEGAMARIHSFRLTKFAQDLANDDRKNESRLVDSTR